MRELKNDLKTCFKIALDREAELEYNTEASRRGRAERREIGSSARTGTLSNENVRSPLILESHVNMDLFVPAFKQALARKGKCLLRTNSNLVPGVQNV